MAHKSKSETLKLSDQGEKFSNAARELGCDEDEVHFEEKLKQVARHKPSPAKTPAKKKSSSSG